jgi:hypothetical protein
MRRSERPRRKARPVTKTDAAKLRRILESEKTPAAATERLKEWAKQRRGLIPKVRQVIMALDKQLPAEVLWAKIEVVLDMIEAEAEED